LLSPLYADSFLAGNRNFPACCIDIYGSNLRSRVRKTYVGQMIRLVNNGWRLLSCDREPLRSQFKTEIHGNPLLLPALVPGCCACRRPWDMGGRRCW